MAYDPNKSYKDVAAEALQDIRDKSDKRIATMDALQKTGGASAVMDAVRAQDGSGSAITDAKKMMGAFETAGGSKAAALVNAGDDSLCLKDALVKNALGGTLGSIVSVKAKGLLIGGGEDVRADAHTRGAGKTPEVTKSGPPLR